MHAAAASGEVAAMAWLKEQNADINARDSKGHTPLAIARQAGAREGDANVIQWMRDNGAM
jgi:ankyrin repeat protein